MEISKAAAIGFEAVLEVRPTPDLVHGLVDHQLLEQRSGRIPGDAPHFEEAFIEPAGEQRAHILIEPCEAWIVARELHQFGTHIDEKLDPVRQRIELGQQLHPRRFERLAQRALDTAPFVFRSHMRDALAGRGDRDAIDVEFIGEQPQETRPAFLG